MDFPGNDVEVSVVDKFHLQNLFFAPGFQKACVTVNGATASNPLGNGKFLHTIDLFELHEQAASPGGFSP